MLRTGRKPPPGREAGEFERLDLLHRSGKIDDAIAGLEALVAAQPKSARLRVRLAEWLAEAGRRDAAIKTLFDYDEMEAVVTAHPRVGMVLDRMYHRRVLARVLAESPLFEFMDAGERQRLASKFEFFQIPKDFEVVAEGSDDAALFLVKRGRVAIRNSRGTELGTIGPNEFFGEVSFLTGVARTASAVTLEASELLRIDRDVLTELTVEHPRLAETLTRFHLDRVQNAIQMAKMSSRT